MLALIFLLYLCIFAGGGYWMERISEWLWED